MSEKTNHTELIAKQKIIKPIIEDVIGDFLEGSRWFRAETF